MTRSIEYFISHAIEEPQPAGTIVNGWPLHLSVIPPFIIPTETDTDFTFGLSENLILERMAQNGRQLGAITLGYGAIRSGAIPIEIGDATLFGAYENLPVVEILDPSNKLHELHSTLLADLGRIGCRYIDLNPEWSGSNYSPHATKKSGKTLDRPFFCTTLTLGSKSGGEKRIVGTVNLCD